MVCVATSLNLTVSCRSRRLASLFCFDLKRHLSPALVLRNGGWDLEAARIVPFHYRPVVDEFRRWRPNNCDGTAAKRKVVVVGDGQFDEVPTIWGLFVRDLKLNVWFKVFFMAFGLTVMKPKAEAGHAEANEGNAVTEFKFHRDYDSLAVSQSQEATRPDGWQAHRSFRLRRACRFVSAPSLLPP